MNVNPLTAPTGRAVNAADMTPVATVGEPIAQSPATPDAGGTHPLPQRTDGIGLASNGDVASRKIHQDGPPPDFQEAARRFGELLPIFRPVIAAPNERHREYLAHASQDAPGRPAVR